MISIVCWKWKPENKAKHEQKRQKFSIRHINILRAMVERNLTLDHQFVCVSQKWKGLHSSIKWVSVDEYFSEYKELGGCYRRLKAFHQETAERHFGEGKFVSIDLDCVITDKIDSIIWFREDFRIWGDEYRRFTPYCGSLWGMIPGARQKQVWEPFRKDPERCIKEASVYQGTDQAHISAKLYPNESTWGVKDGIYNFNTQVRRKNSAVFRREDQVITEQGRTGELPRGARIVFFNGKFDPSQEQLWKHHQWIRDFWHD